MVRAEDSSRPRRRLAKPIPYGVALVAGVLAVALLVVGMMGIALLVAGLSSWLHPGDVAAAWARTLAGIGLIGGSAALTALLWLAVERLAGTGPDGESRVRRAYKFVAVIGILLALVCLPFGAAIHASSRAPWFGWGGSSAGGA
jgi:hypothetical protein